MRLPKCTHPLSGRKGDGHRFLLREILSQKRGKAATLAEVIAWAAETTREKFDPVRKAKRSRRVSSGNAGNSKTECQTDQRTDHSGAPERHRVQAGRQPVPAAVKRPVILRDGMQCAHVSSDGRRCEQKRWLQIHHQVAVKNGGLNTIQNLQTLCQRHHQFVHSREGVALGT
jgi:5-methylcytosine-specific restriction endonuclease McrA